jgi:GNAT superfamily N-acetyltransferase
MDVTVRPLSTLPYSDAMLPTQVVPFDAAHAPALALLYLQARRATFAWMPAERFRLADFERDTDGEVIDVALQEGVPVGFVSVWTPDRFVHHLYVDAAHHRRGIGARLLDHALARIDRPAGLKCIERNTRALDFYAARGWQVRDAGLDAMGPYVFMQLDA